MGSITTTELSPKSYSSSVVAAAYEANSLTLKLDEQLPIWKLWKTEPYRRYEKCINFLHQEGESLLKQWENLSEEKRARCLMDDYAQDSNLTRKGGLEINYRSSVYFQLIIHQPYTHRFIGNGGGVPTCWDGHDIDNHSDDTVSFIQKS